MSFFGELRRRNVFKVAVAYAIVGWLLIEVSTTVLPLFEAPDWIAQVFAFFVILGFPLALILSWAYEITPEGIKLERDVAAEESITHVTGRKIDFAIIGALVLALGFVVYNYVLVDSDQEAIVQETTPTVEPEPAAPLTAIAVLPFDNLSPDPDNSYFASGMHEEILNSLAKLSALDVKSRTSVLRFAENRPPIEEIAALLDVGSILEGSVRFADNRVRVTTQLIEAASGNHLWSETYEHELEDIFAIESDVAMNIANALEAEFTEEEQQRIYTPRTDSPQALAVLWQAGELIYGGDWTAAMPLIDRAIAIDPNFADAYAWRAYGNSTTIYAAAANDPAFLEELEASITRDVERALALNPELGVAFTAVASVHARHRRGAEAQAAFQRAYQLLPYFPPILWLYTDFSRRTGQFARAVRLAEEAVALDPTNELSLFFLGNAQFFASQYEQAAATFHAHLELLPASGANLLLARVEALRGNSDEALKYLQIEEQLRPSPGSLGLVQRALIYALIDRQDDTQRLIASLEQREAEGASIALQIRAVARLAVGETDEVLEILRELTANEDRVTGSGELEAAIRYNIWNLPVLEEPEFVELREQLGFTDF